ncbi:hypothetical protein JTB14_038094 [Gonioctena quinquepunctata]|nr:hypothetical protein JTB14_024653 [Gonioctena quinquepunctata]KAG5866117.1 hypothetical protein JTB14_038094 [Gonioctena quinquepunctata]
MEEGDKSKVVSKYGLNGSHHVLLEGCTFPPEKWRSIAQISFLLHVRTEEKYRKKWINASKRAMAHIPIIDEIIDATRGKNAAKIRGEIGLLADILLVTTGRQAHRMFFPKHMILYISTLRVDGDDNILDTKRKSAGLKGGETFLESFNVSENEGFHANKLSCSVKWELEGDYTDNEASQIIFHCIFGTNKEDPTILEQITDLGTWNNREYQIPGFSRG